MWDVYIVIYTVSIYIFFCCLVFNPDTMNVVLLFGCVSLRFDHIGI